MRLLRSPLIVLSLWRYARPLPATDPATRAGRHLADPDRPQCQLPRIKRDIGIPRGDRGHPGGRRYDVRSLLPGACTPRPVTGQADRGIPQPSGLPTARLCRESGLKGAPQKASGWRKITTTPDRSGKAARPVSARARHTGSGQ